MVILPDIRSVLSPLIGVIASRFFARQASLSALLILDFLAGKFHSRSNQLWKSFLVHQCLGMWLDSLSQYHFPLPHNSTCYSPQYELHIPKKEFSDYRCRRGTRWCGIICVYLVVGWR